MANIRHSHEFKLFRSRFISLFLWPAILSATEVTECNAKTSKGARSHVRVKSYYRRTKTKKVKRRIERTANRRKQEREQLVANETDTALPRRRGRKPGCKIPHVPKSNKAVRVSSRLAKKRPLID